MKMTLKINVNDYTFIIIKKIKITYFRLIIVRSMGQKKPDGQESLTDFFHYCLISSTRSDYFAVKENVERIEQLMIIILLLFLLFLLQR